MLFFVFEIIYFLQKKRPRGVEIGIQKIGARVLLI